MSTAFKNAKQKISQAKLRQLMNEHKNKLKPLMCVLCQSVVRSESVWKVHINSKVHKENIELAKKLKDTKLSNNSTSHKRPASPNNESSTKKIKSILKNSTIVDVHKLPSDFFDRNAHMSKTVAVNITQNDVTSRNINKNGTSTTVDDAMSNINSEMLPEGFFDDPKLDAKARNLEYKDPLEEQWEKFQKEIKEVNSKSAEIIADDQEEATTERQIDEIEEQMRNWSRVLDLERKKDVVKVTAEETLQETSVASSDDEENFNEFLDWRSKKSFK
ncbi:uncharacterized protein CBL_04493 [Carabus blaptoides fortunei]